MGKERNRIDVSGWAPGFKSVEEDGDYREWDCISHSGLKSFVSGKKPRGRNLVVGNLFDCMVLTPHMTKDRYAVTPQEFKLNTKAGKEAYAEFQATVPDKILVRPSEREIAVQMFKALRADKGAWAIIDRCLTAGGGHTQLPILTDLEDSRGVKRRVKVLLDGEVYGKKTFIFDLKHTGWKDEVEFLDALYKFGYDSQGAMYRDAHASIHGDWVPYFWVCVSNRTLKVWVMRMDNIMYTTGRRWYRDVLSLYGAAKDAEAEEVKS